MRSAFLNVIFGDINVPEDAIQKNILNRDRLTIPGGSKFRGYWYIETGAVV
jgi:hypothetical protein